MGETIVTATGSIQGRTAAPEPADATAEEGKVPSGDGMGGAPYPAENAKTGVAAVPNEAESAATTPAEADASATEKPTKGKKE